MVREIDGVGFAFVPRKMVAQPKAFGTAPGLLEPAHDGVTVERYRAAMLQHLLVVAVKGELLKGQGISPATFVARFGGRGLGADRVRRIFRGETMAQLTDVMFWITHLPAVTSVVSEYLGALTADAAVNVPDAGVSEVPTGEGRDSVPAEPEESAASEPEWLVRALRNQRERKAQAAAGMRPPLR